MQTKHVVLRKEKNWRAVNQYAPHQFTRFITVILTHIVYNNFRNNESSAYRSSYLRERFDAQSDGN